ncbi:MAG TPA: P1 family peptidase [Candidatus Limnocylindrales bacterium]|nr:P1 family peptidase [Candidatus Limnocylindrales bacterium]
MAGTPRPRARDIGLRIGVLPPGPTNSIVDVPNVTVGHATVWRDEPDPPAGRGVARTGVTVVIPHTIEDGFRHRYPAGVDVLNGAGEMTGATAVREWGVIQTPIFLASTLAVGRVYDAAVAIIGEAMPRSAEVFIPVVAECDDGALSRPLPVQVSEGDVRAAVAAATGQASGPTAMGAVGAGTGMRCFELKGGIGSASRLVQPVHRWSESPSPDAASYTVGALLLANFGELGRLTIGGVPVGRTLRAEGWPGVAGGRERPGLRGAEGSCIGVVATDAPMSGRQLERLARRVGLGLARTGSTAHHGSGEISIAFSTGLRLPHAPSVPESDVRLVDDEYLDPFFAAVVEATEEAVIDCLFAAETVVGRNGSIVPGLPVDRTRELLEAAGALRGHEG